MNREDSVLDDIDRLVDESLAQGETSDTYLGDRYRAEQPCPWCGRGWHHLAITETIEGMRHGSFGTDEFGGPLFDPDYRYDQDDSAILCPGSEVHGPVHKTGEWDKERRERAKRRSSPPSLYSPPRSNRRIRFIGPFQPWTISIEHDRIMEDVVSDPSILGLPGTRHVIPMVVEDRTSAIFELNDPVTDPTLEWVQENIQDVENTTIDPDGHHFHMQPIQFEFSSYTVFATSLDQEFPDWIEFSTDYPFERHAWFLPYWQPAAAGRQGHEADYAIIDESHLFTEQELRHRVEEARRSSTSRQEVSQNERGQAVLRRRP